MIRWVVVVFIYILISVNLVVLSFHEQTTDCLNFKDLKTEITTPVFQSVSDTDVIQPYQKNSSYWQFKGEPVLLLGGSDQDNLFNHPNLPPEGLEAHLDLLVSVGGN